MLGSMMVCLRAYLSVCLGSDCVLDPTTEQGRLADRQGEQGRWGGESGKREDTSFGHGREGSIIK